MSTRAYPLTWPAGWPRARTRSEAKFGHRGGANDVFKRVSMPVAIERLQEQLDLLRASEVILSTNVELRLDGLPRAQQPAPTDPGAALYFKLKGRDTALACDRWHRVEDNITALAKHLEAIRGMDRWGVGTVEQVFTGYQALPAPEQWWQVLKVPESASLEMIETAWKMMARNAHPDAGGSDAQMARINWARDEGRRARG